MTTNRAPASGPAPAALGRAKSFIDGRFDLFLPYLSDLPLRDQREMMERPFFSLAKSKRLKPIDYKSPDGRIWVYVSANPDYGMATIWDADILIYCASLISDMKRRGLNDIPQTLNIVPYDLLRAIGRPTTGRAYELLNQALDRLQSTTVKTNIRAENRRETTFSWLDSWTQLVDERTGRTRGMTLTLARWFYEGLLMDGGVLAIDRSYFDITGGRERWLYKVARKHAGGAGADGFAISLPTLFEKSGAEGVYRRFKFEIAAIVRRNELPGYHLALEESAGKEPSLRMVRRTALEDAATAPAPEALQAKAHSLVQDMRRKVANKAQGEPAGYITEATEARLRADFPGWDYDNLHQMFREWLGGQGEEAQPRAYQSAFYGFVRRYHARHKHEL